MEVMNLFLSHLLWMADRGAPFAGDNDWEERVVPNAHQQGCNTVSWAPAAAPASATNPVSA